MTSTLVDVGGRRTDAGYGAWLTAAHCHPTEELRHGRKWEDWVEEVKRVDLRQICVMSTDTVDQPRVADLARTVDDGKVVPCFGYHPWAAHTLSLEKTPDARTHYARLFGEAQDDETAALYDALPSPTPLSEALDQLSAHLKSFPQALVGEVGLDRSFRIPDPRVGGRQLTRLQTPIDHQLAVLRPQVQMACALGRSVSMHSVRAAGQTTAFLDEMRKEKSFADIRLVLHSCTLSPESIRGVQQAHPNVYISFSLTINHRQKNLDAQIAACDLDRVLSESDQNCCAELARSVHDVVALIAQVRGEDPAALGARLTENFRVFRGNKHASRDQAL